MKNPCALISVLCVVAWLPGCNPGGGESPRESAQEPLLLGFVGSSADDFWALVRLGCDGAIRQFDDVDLEFRIPESRTAEAQTRILNDLVAAGADGVAVSPIDAEHMTGALNEIAAETLLVCVDSDAEASRRAFYIGTDNVAAGGQLSELLREALPEGGSVVVFIGYPNAQNTRERLVGLEQGLVGSDIRIVDRLVDEVSIPLAQQNAQDALAHHPDLAGMVGLYSYHGPSLLTAVRAAEKAGEVKIVCFDEESGTLAGIAAGEIHGTVAQKPYGFGRQAIRRMVTHLRGDKTQPADEQVLLPTIVVTRENVAAFQAAREAVLRQ